MRALGLVVLAVAAALLWPSMAGAAAPPDPLGSPIMLVVDISGSMGEDDGTGKVKIDGAKLALLDFLAEVEKSVPLGLRVYPDQGGSSCNSGAERFPVGPRDPDVMSAEIRTLQPDGDTPTAEAMREAVEDLRKAGYSRGTLVIVSDGESTCSDPCEAARDIANEGFDLETIAVGFKISDDGRSELRCVADALDGHYVDADDGESLGDTFGKISRPGLAIEIERPDQEVVADTVAQIDANVTNVSQQEARDVVVRLRFEDGSPGVRRPVVRLGNLAPGDPPRRITWTFRPGVHLQEKIGNHLQERTLRYSAIARAANTVSDVQEEGEVRVVDWTEAGKTGPLFRDRRSIAVLGDSYSSGEGADDYLGGTDTSGNACHRSKFTYLLESPRFGIPKENLLACSGGLIGDIASPHAGYGLKAQVDQLKALYGGTPEKVNGVAMTIGGNDAKFSVLAKSCIVQPKGCDDRVYPTLAPHDWEDAKEFRDRVLDVAVLSDRLAGAYESVHGVLNSEDAVRERGSVAPIMVLGYPLPVPLTGRPCSQMLGRLSPQEIMFIGDFAARLNGIVEAGVEIAQERGVPASYVSTTETAFLPEHTVCDLDPYARSLRSFNGTNPSPTEVLSWVFGGMLGKALVTKDVLERSIIEIAHPNKAGYAAETGAIVRWSLGPEGIEADKRLASATAASGDLPVWDASEVDLGQLDGAPAPVLQGSTTYPLTLGGFAPETPVEITIHSDVRILAQVGSDKAGRVSTRVAIPPDMPGGDHRVEVAGVGQDKSKRIVEIPVEVEGDDGLSGQQALTYAAMGTGGLAALAWLMALLGRALGPGRGRQEGT